MTAVRKRLWALVCDRQGATAIEYGLIAALIAAGMLGGLSTLSTAVKSSYQNTANKVQNS